MSTKQTLAILSLICTMILDISVVISQLYVLFSHKNSSLAIVLIVIAVLISMSNFVLSAMLCNKKFMQNKIIIYTNLALLSLLFVIFALALFCGFDIFGFYFMIPAAIIAFVLSVVAISLANNNNVYLATEKEKKINLLKQLKDAGDITEEEFKQLLFKELDKND